MKLFCQLLIAYCLLAASTSCKQKTDYSKEISRLDSASMVLAIAEKTLLVVDTNRLSSSYNAFTENLHVLSKDTVKKITALLLSVAYEQSGNIHNLLANKKNLERAIAESKQRIKGLKHDLAENLIEKNKSAEYIVNELNSAAKICDTVNRSIEKTKSSEIKLDSMKTQITFLVDSLKAK